MKKRILVKRPYRHRKRKVATVATVKRLINRKVETKALALYPADISLGNRYVYAYQPFFQILKGTDSFRRVGASIKDIALQMSFAFTYLGNDSLGSTRLSTGGLLRCMIVKTPRDLPTKATAVNAWTGITATAGTGDDLPLFLSLNSPATSLLDINSDVKVVKQFWLHSTQPTNSLISGDTVFKQVTVRIPRYEYDELTSTGRTMNYYVLVTAQGSKDMPSNASVGTLQAHMLIKWKDA